MAKISPPLKNLVAERVNTEVVKTKTTRFTLSTDDIEEIVLMHIKLSSQDSVEFNWNIGQWASLEVEIVAKE